MLICGKFIIPSQEYLMKSMYIKFTNDFVYTVSGIYCIWNILYLEYTVSGIYCIWNILHLEYTVSRIYCIWNYTVSGTYCICNILYLEYTVSGIYCIWNILYLEYTVIRQMVPNIYYSGGRVKRLESAQDMDVEYCV